MVSQMVGKGLMFKSFLASVRSIKGLSTGARLLPTSRLGCPDWQGRHYLASSWLEARDSAQFPGHSHHRVTRQSAEGEKP